MILVDFNNICIMKHSIAQRELLKEQKEYYKRTGIVDITEKDLANIRKGFINLVLKDLAVYIDRFYKDYGEIVIAADYNKATYWRKTIFPEYKANREKIKGNPFDDLAGQYFHKEKDELSEILKLLNMKVLNSVASTTEEFGTESVEADDIIGVLVRSKGKHLILSSDGDFDQLLIDDRIKRFNLLEGKLVKKTKKEIHEKNQYSLIMGQPKDNIPHTKDKSELTKEFIDWMKAKYSIDLKPTDASKVNSKEFKHLTDEYEKLMYTEDTALLESGKRKKRRNLSAFAKPNFGEVAYTSTFESMSVDDYLNLNPIYRENYELNKELYLLDRIPKRIILAIGKAYLEAEASLNQYEANVKFLEYGIDSLLIHKFK